MFTITLLFIPRDSDACETVTRIVNPSGPYKFRWFAVTMMAQQIEDELALAGSVALKSIEEN